MTTLAVLQPSYLPWLGYFDQIRRADVFVFYDDVQYDKNGWRNRNKIKTTHGPAWLTVPVLIGGRFGERILDVKIDNRKPWARKHLRSLEQAYARAPHRDEVLSLLSRVLDRDWEFMADLNIAATTEISRFMGIGTKFLRASEMNATGGQSGRLMELCGCVGADHYLTGDAARDYLDVDLFERAGIHVEWQDYSHPAYPQLHGEFQSHLSCVDMLMMVGGGAPARATLENSSRSI